MLLVVEKCNRRGICHAIHWYVEANNKGMNDYKKKEKKSNLKYWDLNNLYDWAMSPKLPVNNFKWDENISEFDENFVKNHNEENDGEYFLEADVQYPENLKAFTMIYLFYLKEWKFKSS